jgi:hypothetical protein
MFICLPQWKVKRLGGTLVDIKIALEEEAQNTHILCKVRILAVFQVYVSMLVSSALGRGFEPLSVKPNTIILIVVDSLLRTYYIL